MNRLKVSIGVLLIFILGTLAGSLGTGLYIKHRIGAFVSGGPPPLMHLLMRRMSHQLNLTKEQEAEIDKIVEQTHKEISAFRERYDPEFEKIIDKSFASIRETLDEEQKLKLDALREDLKERRGRIGPPGRHGPHHPHKSGQHPFAVLKERLNLSEEQATKVGPIIEESIKKRRHAIRQQREQRLGRDGSMREELRAIQEDTERRLREILTDKQMEEYRQMEHERRRAMIPEKPGPHPFDMP